jgi:hypothetical protein
VASPETYGYTPVCTCVCGVCVCVCLCKGKGKVVPMLFLTEHHAMKAYSVSGIIAPFIL